MIELEWIATGVAAVGAFAALIKATQFIYKWVAPKVRRMFQNLVQFDDLKEDIKRLDKTGQLMMTGITAILSELKPNSGGSLRDSINRIEKTQIHLEGSTQVMMHEHSHAVFKADAQGNWTWVNRKYNRIGNSTLEEVKGTGWVNCVHPEERDAVEAEWNRSVHENRAFNMSYRMISTDGRVTPVKCSSYRLEDSKGKTIGYVGIIAKERKDGR